MNRRGRLSTRLAQLIQSKLADSMSWSGGTDTGTGLDGRPVHWFLSAQRAGKRLILTETVTTVATGAPARVVRYWLLAPGENGLWHLEAAEKNHEPLDEEWINEELEEALGRLEDPLTAGSMLEVPKARITAPALPPPSQGLWPRRLRTMAASASFIIAFFILMAYSSLQYHRMIRLVGGLNSSIGVSSSKQTQAVLSLSDRLQALDGELEELRDDVYREREAFEFSRKNTAMNVRRQADELPWSEYSRKRAYDYLADRIESSGSYKDILFELSRLPQDNAQAETVMAVDRANIVPLSDYVSTVPGLVYPVRLDGQEYDGGDFMISSGFGELRPSSLGTGGYLPHMAVDIINVRNILTVTPQNSIIRFPGEPGSVVAAADGEFLYVSDNHRIYGWHTEVAHAVPAELQTRYPDAEMITTFYAHLAEKPAWKAGDPVKQNEKVGLIGGTGRVTGPHLHYEVRVYRPEGEFENRFGRFDRLNPYILNPELQN